VARACSPLRRLPTPVRVGWPAMLAAVVVLGGACGGGTKAQPGGRSAGGVAQLQVVATTVLSARMRDLSVASPALGATVKVRLLLPVHYRARPGARWPVLYLLHGCCDTYRSWTRSTDVAALTARSDVLVVMPDGGKAGFYSDWLTGPRWETFHLTELRQILRRDYRASTVMAVAGVSMGGLGALAYAARHRGLFRAAASFSGITDTRLSAQESMRYIGLVRSQGDDPSHLWGDPRGDAAVWAAHNPYDLAPSCAARSCSWRSAPASPGRSIPPARRPARSNPRSPRKTPPSPGGCAP
jgi:diacylglycerol O-acyltransferase/trehalose O-mycolyltransferase